MRPLVDPSPEPLGAAELERYSRHVLLPGLGTEGQLRLRNARVLVVGAGGLGSPVISYLAAAGVGTLGIVDDDVVDTSNLQRQVVHTTGRLGAAKVDSAAAAVAALNPHVRVVTHRLRLDAQNARDVVEGYDLVIDGTDTFPGRYLVSDVCELLGKPCLWGSVLRYDGQVALFWADPPEGPGVTYRDVFGAPPPAHLVPSCAEAGVVGALCGAVGSVMAMEAVKLICGLGRPLLGRLLVLDALEMSWRSLEVRAGAHEPVTVLRDLVVAVPAEPRGLVVTPAELAAGLRDGSAVAVDVRGEGERAIVAIPGALAVPVERFDAGLAPADLAALGIDDGARLVLFCKTGARSARALVELIGTPYEGARHLAGGVLAWVDGVDPGAPRY